MNTFHKITKPLTLVLLLIGSQLTYSQNNLVEGEYYYGYDPGFGSGHAITLNPSTELQQIIDIPQQEGIGAGMHLLHLRFKNSQGKWGFPTSHLVYFTNVVLPATHYTYYVDHPETTQLQTASENNILIVSMEGLEEGLHTLYVQPYYDDGRSLIKGISIKKLFYLGRKRPAIVEAEFYIDEDEGIGSGTPVTITPGVDVSKTFAFEITEDLSLGMHTLFLRVRDENGNWTQNGQYEFEVTELVITGLPKEEKELHAYPNPTNDVLTIPVQGMSNSSQLKIISLQGKILYDQPLSPAINIGHLAAGVYLLKIQDQNRVFSQVILKR